MFRSGSSARAPRTLAFFLAPALLLGGSALAAPGDPLHAPGVTLGPPAAPPPPQAAPAPPVQDVGRGVVTIQRGGRVLGVGIVLQGDGRVVTSLSALGASDAVDIRYSDGHVVHGRAVHRDPAWDLALLVALSGRWTDGLRASEQDPGTGELKGFVAGAGGKPQLVAAHLKGRVETHARDGSDLPGALEIELHGASGANAGAPLIDVAGNVVGVVIHACRVSAEASEKDGGGATKSKGPCPLAPYAAPVSALRSFLSKTPLNAVAPSPWLGIVGAPDASGSTHGVRVMAVAPGSPAEKAGLKTNADKTKAHLIVAVDGRPVDTPEKLAEIIGHHAIGDAVKVLVLDGEKLRELSVVLRAAP